MKLIHTFESGARIYEHNLLRVTVPAGTQNFEEYVYTVMGLDAEAELQRAADLEDLRSQVQAALTAIASERAVIAGGATLAQMRTIVDNSLARQAKTIKVLAHLIELTT